jgi:hypothetical protein
MLKGSTKRPDILVLEANVSPVVIETEVIPAPTVEAEAVARLGEQVRTTGRIILSSIAVRLPARLRAKHGASLRDDLVSAGDLEIALYTGSSPSAASRWPSSGWLLGSAADLSLLTQSASVPPDVIEEAANQLVSGVSEAAGLLQDIATTYSGAIHKISEELFQEDGEQTRRMAATILANAFIFQESLAGGPGELANVRSLDELRDNNGGIRKSELLAEWKKILKVNYWPIFDIARRILQVIPATYSKPLIERIAETAARLLENRLMRSHDLTGAVFQRLIADRKFLAAYYTTPASAALLAGLAIPSDRMPSGKPWANADDLHELRIADFACGTGTLVSTAYQRVGQLHELAGGDSEALHPHMMAHTLIGCDVLPAAAHLTASMLSGAHPTAGEASIFLLLAHRKLKLGGTLALVMPLSLMSGDSWEDSRKLLTSSYTDLILVSIAGAADEDMSFSADTGMGECLVVGRKSSTASKRATFVVLNERPAYPLLGASDVPTGPDKSARCLVSERACRKALLCRHRVLSR